MCRFCGVSCPIVVEMEDGRPVKVTGNKASPMFHGFCCTRGQALPEHLASPSRLLHSREMGSDGIHRPIASGALVERVSSRLREIIDAHGPDSVALYIGTYAVSYPAGMALSLAFMQALGSPMIFSSSTIDQPGKDITNALLGSWEGGMQPFDGSDVWMMVGANPLLSFAAGMPVQNTGYRLTRAIEQGMQLIVVDPRRSQTAERAAIHLQPLPGHDAALLAAMLHVILAEELHDRDFVRDNVAGVEALRDQLRPCTPQWAAARADVPAQQIVDAARLFATARRGLVAGGTGSNMSGHSSLTEYLMQSLNMLCGRVLREGEIVPNPGVLLGRAIPRAQARPPRPAVFPELPLGVRGLCMSAAGMPTAGLADAILAGRIKALFSLGGNPVVAWPDQNRTVAALERIPLFVQLDIRMSPSAQLAHFVAAPPISFEVPGISYCNEPYEAYASIWGFPEPYGLYAPPLVDPPPGSDLIEEWRVFHGLARSLELELTLHPVDAVSSGTRREPRPSVPLDMEREYSTDDIYEVITRGSRIPLEEVKRHPDGGLFPEDIPVAPKESGCDTRVDVGNPEMMAELNELAEERVERSTLRPFLMISRRSAHVYNSSGRDLPKLIRKGGVSNPAYLHPDDLAQLGIAGGDAVRIRSAHGEIMALAAADPRLRRGMVSISHAFGGLPREKHLFRQIGANTSQLTSVEDGDDRFSGIPRMSGVPVSVERLCSSAEPQPAVPTQLQPA